MGNLLYTIAVALLIIWIIGFMGYGIGGVVHILLFFAFVAMLLRVIRTKQVLIK
jgi:hypothetical protein